MLVRYVCVCVCVCVCVSVCLSVCLPVFHTPVLYQNSYATRTQRHTKAQGFNSFLMSNIFAKFKRVHPQRERQIRLKEQKIISIKQKHYSIHVPMTMTRGRARVFFLQNLTRDAQATGTAYHRSWRPPGGVNPHLARIALACAAAFCTLCSPFRFLLERWFMTLIYIRIAARAKMANVFSFSQRTAEA